jgi:hypothetical protein
MFTGDPITPERTERIGLVNYVVTAARLMDKANELATKFAEGPRLGLRVTKRAMHLSTYDRLAAHMEFEAAVQSHMIRAGKDQSRIFRSCALFLGNTVGVIAHITGKKSGLIDLLSGIAVAETGHLAVDAD